MTCRGDEKLAVRQKTRENKFNEIFPNAIMRYCIKKFKTRIVAFSGGTDSTTLLYLLSKGVLDHKPLLSYIDYIIYTNTLMASRKTIDYVHKVVEVLGVKDKLRILRPKKTRKELEKIIQEDYSRNQGKKHSKDNYRCCYYAKEKPMIDFLIENNLDLGSTIIFQGVRTNESDLRFKVGLQIVSMGKLYHFNYQKMKTQCCSPLIMLENQVKKKLLKEFTVKYRIDYPSVTGCILCPIFLKFANKREQKTEQYRKVLSFFGQDSIEKYLGVESET